MEATGKVECKGCKYYKFSADIDGYEEKCIAPANKMVQLTYRGTYTEYRKLPSDKNALNDCQDYSKYKFWEDTRFWWWIVGIVVLMDMAMRTKVIIP